MGQLDGKVAIVTGAASGIGKATTALMAAEGARVLAVDINEKALAAVVDAIKATGAEATACRADITEEAQVASMIQTAVTRYGRLDILHNNAHTGQDDDIDVVSNSRDVWDRVMAGTLYGVVYGCKYGVPAMLANGGGSIINMSSNAYIGGDVVRVAYAAAKSGVNSVTKYTATVFGKKGIRCNAISPGVLVTPPVLKMFPPSVREVILEHVLAPRMGEPEDGARLAVFLGSDAASFINGQIISCDGGLNAHLGAVPQLVRAMTSASTRDRAVEPGRTA
jgi:NAD(P)-dependent dehydrogenase (short-subunit alcohol dehydrogenase family)